LGIGLFQFVSQALRNLQFLRFPVPLEIAPLKVMSDKGAVAGARTAELLWPDRESRALIKVEN
jgi:hypothetical protein